MEQIAVFSTLALALVLFIWGRIRYDVAALLCLLILVVAGAVPAEEAFSGFAHPAVITVAAVLVVGRGIQKSGLVDVIAQQMMRLGRTPTVQVASLCGLIALVSAFMNNVGALAILMPVAIHIAGKHKFPPSLLLMPLAFSSLLGGMITLIGTPPNILIATFRNGELGEPFGLFDFAPVGGGLTLAGLAFITFVGWRLLPKREGVTADQDRFHIDDYITEVRITGNSPLLGTSVREIKKITGTDIQLLGLIRNKRLIHTPPLNEEFLAGDILIIEAGSEELRAFVRKSKTVLEGDKQLRMEAAGSDEVSTVEAVVMADSAVLNETAASLLMRSRYGVNLLAVARQGKNIRQRLDRVRFGLGDVLLLQGPTEKINFAIKSMGCLPLADRGYSIGTPKNILLGLAIFGFSILLVVLRLAEVQIAFTIAAVLMVLFRLLPLKEIYTTIDWPVIVLLGAMLPVGAALESSGGADLIAGQILAAGRTLPVWATLTLLLVVTMLLSGVINNAATVVLMAPIGIHIATGLEASPDPFLMIIAVGASCSFLTPIGHQSNTLVMGPGGYTFNDYFRMGLPLSLLVAAVAVPLILFFWPL